MSAINPASFVTPSPTAQLGSSLGAGASIPDRDRFGDTRNRKDVSAFPIACLAQHSQGVFDHGWNSSPDVNLSSMISTAYPQFYNSQTFDAQQMSHGTSDFNRGVATVNRTQSPFTYQRNTTFRGAPSGYLNTEFKNNLSRQIYANAEPDWQKGFYGLSLGS